VKTRVYLAGPDVFRPDFQDVFDYRSAYCEMRNIKALVPVDNRLSNASEIYEHNVRLMDSADAIVANISPFRGPHCDVGTAFEIGYGKARGLPIWVFSDDTRKLSARISSPLHDGKDSDGLSIEPFSLYENLMIEFSVCDRVLHKTFESALDTAAQALVKQGRGS
jgi:nucleoside 2-deoxyribosyltransferase